MNELGFERACGAFRVGLQQLRSRTVMERSWGLVVIGAMHIWWRRRSRKLERCRVVGKKETAEASLEQLLMRMETVESRTGFGRVEDEISGS